MLIKEILLELIYPENIKCIGCSCEILPNDYSMCPNCIEKLTFNKKIRWEDCKNKWIDGKIYVVKYDDFSKKLIFKLKYFDHRENGKPIAFMMSQYIKKLEMAFDLIIPVPMFRKKLNIRGFNQMDLIGGYMSNHLGIDCNREVLLRVKDTPELNNLMPQKRLSVLKEAFQVDSSYDLSGKRILVIDDIYTTGATVINCAKELKKHGAVNVSVCTFALAGSGGY